MTKRSVVERLDQKVLDAALPLLEGLDTPRALTVVIMLRYREYAELVKLRALPKHYADAVKYQRSVAATDLFRKYKGIPTGVDTRAAAVEAFGKSERRCALTNTRLRDFTTGINVNHIGDCRHIHQAVDAMRTFVREVLGGLPSELNFRVGPGATVSDGAKQATVPDKFSSIPSITSGADFILPLWDRSAWAQAHYRRVHDRIAKPVRVVRGNSFFTVPKDATKDRGAAKGPSINVSAQLAVGREIRHRLKRVGIDLKTGQDVHSELAREGSVTESCATIDLESASDTVSYQFVKLILPTLWFDVLSNLREPLTEVDGSWHFLEKFSAMGNGFTFELETLGFLAIIAAAVKLYDGDDMAQLIANKQVSVYGDDMIVPRRYTDTVLSLLRFFGFAINKDKTFVEGSFRESCGGDFFQGREVTPFRLEDEITEPHHWIAFANGILSLGRRLSGSDSVSDSVTRSYLRVVSNIPEDVRRHTGPCWLGDVVLHGDPGWRANLTERFGRVWLPTWQPIQTRLHWGHWYPDVQLASALYGAESRGVLPRGTSGYHRKRVGRPRYVWGDQSLDRPLYRRLLRVTGAPA